RALDVRHAIGDVLALALAGPAPAWLGLRHLLPDLLEPHRNRRLRWGPRAAHDFFHAHHLLADLLLSGDRLFRALAGASVRLRPLTAHRQPLTMAKALVAADLHLALDVLLDVPAQIALDLEVGVDVGADAVHL